MGVFAEHAFAFGAADVDGSPVVFDVHFGIGWFGGHDGAGGVCVVGQGGCCGDACGGEGKQDEGDARRYIAHVHTVSPCPFCAILWWAGCFDLNWRGLRGISSGDVVAMHVWLAFSCGGHLWHSFLWGNREKPNRPVRKNL